MMQFNPFLTSIAAPAAAKTVQAVVHVAHEAGQSFLKTLNGLRENPSETASALAEPTTLAGQVQSLAGSFREWLGKQGIESPFEMQFSLANNGDPIANVVGPESEKIVDALYSDDAWLEKFSALAARASQDAVPPISGMSASNYGESVKLAITADDAYVIRDSPHAF